MCLLGNFLCQIQDKKQLKEGGKDLFGLTVWEIKPVAVRRRGKGIFTAHLSAHQGAKQQTLKTFSHPHPPPKAQLLKTVPPAGDQMFKLRACGGHFIFKP